MNFPETWLLWQSNLLGNYNSRWFFIRKTRQRDWRTLDDTVKKVEQTVAEYRWMNRMAIINSHWHFVSQNGQYFYNDSVYVIC